MEAADDMGPAPGSDCTPSAFSILVSDLLPIWTTMAALWA
jgi:hypothetical protein